MLESGVRFAGPVATAYAMHPTDATAVHRTPGQSGRCSDLVEGREDAGKGRVIPDRRSESGKRSHESTELPGMLADMVSESHPFCALRKYHEISAASRTPDARLGCLSRKFTAVGAFFSASIS